MSLYLWPAEGEEPQELMDVDIVEVVCRTCKDWFAPVFDNDEECEDCVAAANEDVE